MTISKGMFRYEGVEQQRLRACSKKSSSPALSGVEGKAAAFFARGAYLLYVSTEKWRPAYAKPLPAFVAEATSAE